MTGTLAEVETDVLIVGYGPVGQVLAILLAQQGHSVVVAERWPRPYPMPRAVSYDGESARIVAATGVGDVLDPIREPSRDYTWRNAAGATLLHVEVADPGRCGWPDSTSVYQPGLEQALAGRGAALPGLRVLRGHRATTLTEHGDRVAVTLAEQGGGRRVISARWVIGCDGANSFVRDQLGTRVVDLGFSNDWLTCDVVMREPRRFEPNNLQICDPDRPTTVVSAGPGHRRWEFMRVPGESRADLDDPETAWRLLAPSGVHPGNAILERQAVYTFQARYADSWRSGRMLIAGDAAHLMPPFAGQGMCSGFRDAANLAWKLDLVLRGQAGEALLDTYAAERRAHVQHAIGMSVNLGKVICQADPKAAADRDTVMLARRERAPGPTGEPAQYQPLTTGLIAAGRPLAGQLCPQGRVTRDGVTGWFDDVVGTGFVLLTTEPLGRILDEGTQDLLERYRIRLVRLVGADEPASGAEVADVDGVLGRALTGAGVVAALVRPDFYFFGGARDRHEAGALTGRLHELLAGAPAAIRS